MQLVLLPLSILNRCVKPPAVVGDQPGRGADDPGDEKRGQGEAKSCGRSRHFGSGSKPCVGTPDEEGEEGQHRGFYEREYAGIDSEEDGEAAEYLCFSGPPA